MMCSDSNSTVYAKFICMIHSLCLLSDKGDVILDHITRVQVTDEIRFNETTGDSLVARFDILNLRQPGSGGYCNQHCYKEVSCLIVALSLAY